MKSKFLIGILTAFLCGIFFSCDDEGVLKEREYTITFKVTSNSPQVPITVYGANPGGVIINEDWETEFVRKGAGTIQLSAYCNDVETLISGEIYVDGKFCNSKDGYGYIAIAVELGGNSLLK